MATLAGSSANAIERGLITLFLLALPVTQRVSFPVTSLTSLGMAAPSIPPSGLAVPLISASSKATSSIAATGQAASVIVAPLRGSDSSRRGQLGVIIIMASFPTTAPAALA